MQETDGMSAAWEGWLRGCRGKSFSNNATEREAYIAQSYSTEGNTMQTVSRSYKVRLEGGERVRLIEPHGFDEGSIPVGTEGNVRYRDSNAGFRGIEATVDWDTGQTSYSVSTGKLEVIS